MFEFRIYVSQDHIYMNQRENHLHEDKKLLAQALREMFQKDIHLQNSLLHLSSFIEFKTKLPRCQVMIVIRTF